MDRVQITSFCATLANVTFPPAWEAHFREEGRKLAAAHGLRDSFAPRVAALLAYLRAFGLNPRVTSGFRDPKKQEAMRKAWDAGNRAGLRARPALVSQHTATFLGRAASDAVDIVSSNEALAARIAKALGINAGFFFATSDPGHYDNR